MTARSSIWRSALSLLSIRLVLEQIGLALIVFLLFTLWLRVPDASILDVVATVVLALLIIAVAGFGEFAVLLRLCNRARTVRLLLFGTLLLAACVALWFSWSAILGSLRGNDFERAGYYNSQLPHQLRYFFTYERIALWLSWFWNTLSWTGAGLLALLAVCATCSTRPQRAIVTALHSLSWWLTLLVGAFAASVITNSLVSWTPGHGLRREMLSLIARLSTAVIVDAVILCLLLSIIAACCRRVADDEAQSTPAGRPELNQPRTVGNP